MSFFQRLLGGGHAGSSGGQPGGGEASVSPDDLVDVCFDESQRGEAELAALFQSYERALQVDRGVAREILLRFFDRLAAAAATWRPHPAAILAARAAAAAVAGRADRAGGGGGGRAQLQLVRNCSGGHPRALLAAAVECLEQAPGELLAAAAAAGRAVQGPARQGEEEGAAAGRAADPVASTEQLSMAGGLPALRALRVLLRSQHNRAVLAGLGLLPALCTLLSHLAQQLQAAVGHPGPGSGGSAPAPASGDGPLEALLLLLQAALAVARAFSEHEAAHQQQIASAAAAPAGASTAGGHAAQAAAQASAAAAAAAAAGAVSAAAVAPLLERGLVPLCCELLPLLVQIRLRLGGTCSSPEEGLPSPLLQQQQQQGQEGRQARVLAAASALEQVTLMCLLALLAASPVPAAAALAQQRGGRGLELLVGCLGWPLASAAQQLPDPASDSLAEKPARVCSGGGLRPPAEELRLQLLALRALGAALRAGGGAGAACLRGVRRLGGLPRLTQLLQWAALTFEDSAAAPGSPSGGGGDPESGGKLAQLFAVLWGWLGGAGGHSATALQLAVLEAVLAAFRPLSEPPDAAAHADKTSPAGSSGRGSAEADGGLSPTAAEQPLALSAAAPATPHYTANAAFHDRALAALSGGPGAPRCGCALQQQTALLAARLLGREGRLAPLLDAASWPQPDGQHLLSSGGGSGNGGEGWAAGPSGAEAAAALQSLRAAGLWDVLFGPCFFFWGDAGAERGTQPGAAAAAQREGLRQLALTLAEAAASLPASPGSLPEVAALLGLAAGHPRRHAVVAAACRVLLRLLGAAPATTLAALQERQLLAVLPRLLAQHIAEEEEEEGREREGAERRPGSAGAVAASEAERAPPARLAAREDARCAVLELLCAFMSLHPSLARAAVAAWEPVAALFTLLLRPPCPSRRLALDGVLLLMQVAPAGEDDRLAKAALFSKYTETLPAAVQRWRQLGLQLLLELLAGMRAAVGAGGFAPAPGPSAPPAPAAAGFGGAAAQQLFARAQAFLQVCNVLNEDYEAADGPPLCCAVLDTLTALLAGSPGGRAALARDVGYAALLQALLARLGAAPPPRRLLLCALGLLLEEAPGPGAQPRFASAAISNPAAMPLLAALLRRAAAPDALWGLAALRELLLQGPRNLAAAQSAGLNTLLIALLQDAAGSQQPPEDPPGAAAAAASCVAAPPGQGGEAAAEGGSATGDVEPPCGLLVRQLLALLRVSGGYSIAAGELRLLLRLLRAGPDGELPPHAAPLLETLAAMAAHEGPRCFFSISAGTEGAAGGGPESLGAELPAGVVCAPSLGGGGGGGGAAVAAFPRLPRGGYSFAVWIRVEDGRAAAEQLAQASGPPSRSTAAAAAGQPSAADQAVYALLHQQPVSATRHTPNASPAGAQQLLQGVALAVRAGRPPGSGGGGGHGPSPALHLVAHCWTPNHSEEALPLQQPLLPGRWHHVAAAHSPGGALSHPSLALFLDGRLQATARVRYPPTKEPLSSVCLGTGALLRPLRGQAGAALLFDGLLAPAHVAALHQLGPDYQSPLLGSAESSGLLDSHPAAAAALALGGAPDGGEAAQPQGPPPRLLLALCPETAAADGSSGSGGGSSGGGGRALRDAAAGLPAALLPGSQLCRTKQPRDVLHCLGGVAALLPLLQQPAGSGGDAAPGVLRLLAAMLRGSPTNQQAALEADVFALAAHLLQQAPGARPRLGPQLLAAQQALLAAADGAPELGAAALRHLLLNLRLWSGAAPGVQLQLAALWRQLAKGEPLLVRHLLPPVRLLHHIRRTWLGSGGGGAAAARAARQPASVEQQGGSAAASASDSGHPEEAEAEAAASEGVSAELRRAYLQLAAVIMMEAAAAGSRGEAGEGEAGGQSGRSSPGGEPDGGGLMADLQAALALMADCCASLAAARGTNSGTTSTGNGTAALLQELLSLLLLPVLRRDSLARTPLLAALRRAGGPALLLPLLGLEQQQLRLLGLRAVTACLGVADTSAAAHGGGAAAAAVHPVSNLGALQHGSSAAASALAGPGSRPPSRTEGPPGPPPHRLDPDEEVVAAAGQLLGGFPFTPATRIALFEMLCDGLPWQQIDSLAEARFTGSPQAPAAAASPVRIRHPAAAALLLQAAADDGGGGAERGAVLGVLCALCESASLAKQAQQGNQDMLLAAPCPWPALLLRCLAVGEEGDVHGGRGSSPAAGPAAADAAAAAVWRLLVLLMARAVAASPGGWQLLHAVTALLRAAPGRRYMRPPSASGGGGTADSLTGWELLHELLADVVLEILAAQAADALGDGGSPHGGGGAAISPLAAAADALGLARGGGAAAALRRASSEWDAWTLVSQWSTEPYCSNAAALLALLDDLLAGAALSPPGDSPAPSGGADASGRGGEAEGGPALPAALWQALGAGQQPPPPSRLEAAAWRLLDSLVSSGAAAAAAAEARGPGSATAALLRALRGPGGPAAWLSRSNAAGGEGGESGGGAAGLSSQQLEWQQRLRGLSLLLRLLLLALARPAPQAAQQAAAKAVRLLPGLLPGPPAGSAGADAAAAPLHLLLAAVLQCHASLAAGEAAQQPQGQQQQQQQQQQQLEACVAAGCAVVDAAPADFGLPAGWPAAEPAATPPRSPRGALAAAPGRRQPRSAAELRALLRTDLAAAAARQQLLFMRHCAGMHAAAAPQLLQQIEAAAAAQRLRAAAAEEASRQCLGAMLAADRLRRAAARQAEEEAAQAAARRWRDALRGLTGGQGLWAGEERQDELHWKLDATEDPARRRLRLRRNFHFERYSDPPRIGSTASLAAAAAAAASGAAAEDEEAALRALAKLVPGASPRATQGDEPDMFEEGEEEGEEEEGREEEQDRRRLKEGEEEGRGEEGLEEEQDRRRLKEGEEEEEREAAGPADIPASADGPSGAAEGQQGQVRQQRMQQAQQASAPGQPPGAECRSQASPAGLAEGGRPPPVQQAPAAAAQQAQRPQPAAAAQQPGEAQQAQQASQLPSEQQGRQAGEASTPAAVAAADEAAAAEALLFSGSCRWVTPKRVLFGRLHITPTQLHFIADPEGDNGGASRPGSSAAESAEEAAGEGPEPAPRRRHQRWQLEGLTEVHHSRYLLQPTALECFMADRRSHALLSFPSNQAMREAAAALARARPGVPVYDRRRKVEWAARLQQRWLRWEISSFEYLMGLNTLAGRTYCDLNQYPVFPWVLADYTSPSLDLNDPASYRDLGKPVGALNPRRWEFFADRFESLRADGRAAEMPPFHYGSHYSSAGTVLFYLVRLESFTKMNRALQGGRFDHGDRMFHSIEATWRNCLENTADVKELIPEFFYQPEFLLNSNAFDLGRKQDGSPLGDVELPPWAHGSPDEFVRIQREALEGDHASAHLHHWIDLVFGCKQRGRAAEEARNVFFHLTYEGAADLDAIQDATLRAAVEEQILHFGQTPLQLFRRPHPARGPPPPPALAPLLNGPDALRRAAVAPPPPGRAGVPLAGLAVGEGRVLLLWADRSASAARWLPSGRADLGPFTFAAAGGLLPDTSAASLEPDPAPPRQLAGAWAASAAPAAALPPLAALHGGRVVLSGGYWDGSLRAHSPEDGRLLQCLAYHRDQVTCLAASSDGQVVVTGSADTTLMVWAANAAFGRGSRGRQPLPLLPRPRRSLHGHRSAVACVAVSPELDLVASGAADGPLLLHSLRTGQALRSLALPHGGPPALLCLSPRLGALVAHSHTDLALHLYTLNGRRLASQDTHERLACLCPAADGRLLLAAGTSGLASLRWMHSLQVVLRFDGGRGPVTALAATPEGCLLAGTAEGSLLLFAPDPRRRITRRVAVT